MVDRRAERLLRAISKAGRTVKEPEEASPPNVRTGTKNTPSGRQPAEDLDKAADPAEPDATSVLTSEKIWLESNPSPVDWAIALAEDPGSIPAGVRRKIEAFFDARESDVFAGSMWW